MEYKHFFEKAEDLVVDCLESLVLLNEELVLDKDNKAVFAISSDCSTRVSLIAGGGAGHEPAHAAFVGKGMLSGAVSGFVFASPSVAQIVNSIRCVGGEAGTVLIIKNYTGDVFHFHLAAEKALANYGIRVEVVVVGDDVSVGRKKSGKVGRRGLAGTVLVHKILGSMVFTPGSTLKQTAATGRLVASSLVTVGASLGHVHVPGRGAMLDAVAGNSVELGMGIHNETGCQILNPRPDLPTLVEMMLDQLLDQKDSDRAYVDMNNAEEIVLLINNLGSVSELEFGGITTQVLKALKSRNIRLTRVLSGTYMTSLDGPGFSITMLKATADMIEHIDAPTTASGWKPARVPNYNDKRYLEPILGGSHTPTSSKNNANCLSYTVAGDGDCGITLARGAAAILEWIPSVQAGSNAVGTILSLTEVIERNMDGTSGAIYAIFFAALASALRSIPSNTHALNSKLWGEVATKALIQLQLATPARQGDRTLMDALEPFIHSISSGCSLKTAALAAKLGAEATKGMPAAFGRAVYVADDVFKEVPDPGAIGVVCIAEGLAEVS